MKLSNKCLMCWHDYKIIMYSVKFIGIQKGISFDLKLYNFRQTVRKNGADELVEENTDLQNFLKNI